MKTGDKVILQTIHDGKVAASIDAIVIGGEDNALMVAFLNPAKSDLLIGADWRTAFDRKVNLRPASHMDVIAGKEVYAYVPFEPEVLAEPAEHSEAIGVEPVEPFEPEAHHPVGE